MVRANVLPCLQEERQHEYSRKTNYGKTIRYTDFMSKQAKTVIPKGCKLWNILGITVMALNEKNAIRKAKNVINGKHK